MKKNNNNNVVIVLSFFLFFTISILLTFNFILKIDNPSDDNSYENKLLGSGTAKTFEKKTIDHNLENKNISLEPYGCFTNIKNQFFQERVNPYSKERNELGSSYYIKEGGNDIDKLIKDVIKNGYVSYGNKILKKYEKTGSKGISILEIAKLAKLCGYNYINILKYPEGSDQYGKIYLTYTPPTINSSLYRYNNNFTDEEFNSILTDSDLPEYKLTPKVNDDNKEFVCGYPCTINGKLETFTDSQGDVRQYMCGSVNYPNLKTPERYAVYKIN
jgi:hypothetical protein